MDKETCQWLTQVEFKNNKNANQKDNIEKIANLVVAEKEAQTNNQCH